MWVWLLASLITFSKSITKMVGLAPPFQKVEKMDNMSLAPPFLKVEKMDNMSLAPPFLKVD